jgi:hypothetical protein
MSRQISIVIEILEEVDEIEVLKEIKKFFNSHNLKIIGIHSKLLTY